jgi:hypothetical protein
MEKNERQTTVSYPNLNLHATTFCFIMVYKMTVFQLWLAYGDMIWASISSSVMHINNTFSAY